MKNELGQGLVEYAIVLVLVVVVLFGCWLLFGASLVQGVMAGNPISIFIAATIILSVLGGGKTVVVYRQRRRRG